MSASPILATRDLGLDIGGATIVAGVGLEVGEGELLAIIGPNGAGKTTLFNLVSGLTRPTSGTVLLDGVDITAEPPFRRARAGIGRTFQVSNVFPLLSALENVRLAAEAALGGTMRIWRQANRVRAAVERAHWALGRVGLEARGPLPAGLLSHGDKRKLELAMVLAGDARVILLDEPMAGVSMENVPELVELIRSVHAEGQDGADGRAPHGGRHGTRAADRRAAPRGTARRRHAGGDHAERDRAAGLPRGADLMALVEVRDLHVRIGESHILQGIEFDVAEGGVTALLGRNGVGKTTTLRALMGLVDRAGLVRYDGADITHMPTYKIVRRGVGYVPEDRDVFAALTVDENLRLAERSAEPRYDLVYDLFPELRERGKQLAGTLSGGQQQMVAIARALLNDNRVLFVDEPTKGLSPLLVSEVARVLERVSELTTVLLVEQNLGVVARVARDAVVLDTGRVVHTGPAQELLDDKAMVQRMMGVGARRRVSTFVLLTITGLGLGAMYFLIASGLSLIYGLMGVLNFAHGAFLTIGAYAFWFTETKLDSLSIWPRFLLAARGGDRRHDGVLGTGRARDDPAALRPAHRAGARHGRPRARDHRARDRDLGQRRARRSPPRSGWARRPRCSVRTSRTTAGPRSAPRCSCSSGSRRS